LLNDNWKDTQQAAIEASSFGPPILYLASIVLFPPESALDEFVDYKAHYYANHRAFFILFSCFTPVDFADSLLKGIPHFFELGRPRSRATNATTNSMPSFFSSRQPALASPFSTP